MPFGTSSLSRCGPRAARWLLPLALALAACSSSDGVGSDAGAPSTDAAGPPSADAEPPFADPFVVITAPRGPAVTTAQAAIELAGVAVGALEKLAYEVIGQGGVPPTNGGLQVAQRWAVPDLALSPGDNRITVRALTADGHTVQDSIVVTYNPQLALGPVGVAPAEIFVGQQTPVLLQLQIDQPELVEPLGARVIAVDEQGEPVGSELATLADDGAAGDEIAGDGVFSASLTIADGTAADHRLRVLVTVSLPGGATAEARSEVFTVKVLVPLTAQDLAELESAQQLVRDTYNARRASLDNAKALAAVVEVLEARPEVAEAGLSDSGAEIWWEMRSGIVASFSDYPEGTKAGGGDAPISAILLEPFAAEFGAEAEAKPVRDVLETYLCPEVEPIELALDKAVTLEKLRQLDRYQLVFIDSHGGVAERAKVVYFTIEEPLNKAELADPTSLTHKDLVTKRIAVSGRKGKSSWTYAISSRFIEHYNRGFPPNSLAHLGSCSGLGNSTMAAAFLKGGVEAFTAFTSVVYNDYALAVAKRYYQELSRGRSVGEAVATVHREVGRADPYNAACRFDVVPRGSSLRLTVGCNGFTRVVDEVSYGQITASTTYYSTDRLEPDPAQLLAQQPVTVYHVRESLRSCQFSRVERSTQGAVASEEAGDGSLHDEYPSYLDRDPSILQKRTGIMKLKLDRQAGKVTVTLVPEPADYDDDDWVTWNSYRDGQLDSTEQHGCPFWGPVRDQLQPSVFEASGADVQLTVDHVKIKKTLTNEDGQSTVEIDYALPAAQ